MAVCSQQRVLLLFSAWWAGAPCQKTQLDELEVFSAQLDFTRRTVSPPSRLQDCVRERDFETVVELVRSGHFRAIIGEQTALVLLQAHLRRLGLPPMPAVVITMEGDFGTLEVFGRLAANPQCPDPVRALAHGKETIWCPSSLAQRSALLEIGVLPERLVHLPFCTFLRDLCNPASRRWREQPEGVDAGLLAQAQGRLIAAGIFNRDYVTFLKACRALGAEPLILTDVEKLHQALPADEVRRFEAAYAATPGAARETVSPQSYFAYLEAAAAVVVPLYRPDLTSGHLTIADAQRLGRPVVATDLPAARDFIEDGRSGLLYTLHDDDHLRAQLQRLSDDPQLAASLAAEGRRREAQLSAQTRHALLTALRGLAHVGDEWLAELRRAEPQAGENHPAPPSESGSSVDARGTEPQEANHHAQLRRHLAAPSDQWELSGWEATPTEAVVTVTAYRPERLEATLVFTRRDRPGGYLERTRYYNAGLRGTGYSRRAEAMAQAVIAWVRRQERRLGRSPQRREPATPAAEVQRSPQKTQSPPLIFDVEVTNRCNLQCRMCPRDRLTRPKGRMTPETMQRLVVAMQALPVDDRARMVVGFAGMGEPLLHPQLPRLIGLIKQGLGCVVGVTTNGLRLDDDCGRRLVEAGLDVLHVSVHGLYGVHDEIVGAEVFEQVQRNVERFTENAAGATAVQIVLVQSELNRARLDLELVRQYWEARGVRGVDLITCHSRGGNLEDPSVLARTGEVPPDCPQFLPIQFFTWEGDLLACCSDLQGTTRLGNIHLDTIAELLQRKADIDNPRLKFPQCGHCPDRLSAAVRRPS